MQFSLSRKQLAWIGGGVATLLVAVTTVAFAQASLPDPGANGPVGPSMQAGAPSVAAGPTGTGAPVATSPPPVVPETTAAGGDLQCPAATVTVSDAAALKLALAEAAPGTSIRMKDGTYVGEFKATAAGTAERPVYLCGGPGAVIDGDGVKKGYALHLDGASYWRVIGFTVRNGQKGVMADRVQRTVIQGLTVENIGDEAIHLRNFSSDNLVQGNTIRNTGLRRDKFGEGVYIGTAESNWCTITACKPDASDRNVVRGNNISATTAESVDIKEGTTGGTLSGNTFDGASLSGDNNDSWVDVKGNGWLIEGNAGTRTLQDGYQTHEILDGWGSGNTFRNNRSDVNAPGYGYNFTKVNGNTLTCDNTAVGAAKGLANVSCS